MHAFFYASIYRHLRHCRQQTLAGSTTPRAGHTAILLYADAPTPCNSSVLHCRRTSCVVAPTSTRRPLPSPP